MPATSPSVSVRRGRRSFHNIGGHAMRPCMAKTRSVDRQLLAVWPGRSFVAMVQRQMVLRIVSGVLIVVCALWCGRAGLHAYHLVTTLHALGINAVRLEQVDSMLAPGSRVELDGVTVATL